MGAVKTAPALGVLGFKWGVGSPLSIPPFPPPTQALAHLRSCNFFICEDAVQPAEPRRRCHRMQQTLPFLLLLLTPPGAGREDTLYPQPPGRPGTPGVKGGQRGRAPNPGSQGIYYTIKYLKKGPCTRRGGAGAAPENGNGSRKGELRWGCLQRSGGSCLA